MSKFEDTMRILRERFGSENVLIRKSSSGKGYHVRVINADITPADELKLRKELGDCAGRCVADEARLKSGMNTSRLFKCRSTTKIDRVGKTSTLKSLKTSGDWST